ncbi:N-succinylarginine dihydrolase [Phenylobacterium koreense]|uniref:N-succinylarginine dihydrolase n=1 Tax=Phenylobacterium koreense TaxID=266125 RepID=A0ABV2ELK3_9CAUL
MSAVEINFDGLPGPTHNYAGLSVGNVASQSNFGEVSYPRAAALQGLEKMRRLMELGLPQGFLPPPRRPAAQALRAFGFRGGEDEVLAAAAESDLALFRAACSASSMWRANAATVLAAPDTADGRVHLVTANLSGMLHRSLEADETWALLKRVFPNEDRFAVHGPLPHGRHFGDEGAANHMRLAASHGAPGINVFAHGESRGGAYPERQSRRASEVVARLAGLAPERTLFALQNAGAVQAGAFHNDVVAVANGPVIFAHPEAFADPARLYGELHARLPNLQVVETFGVSLEDAVTSYLFNSQLVSLPDGGMALILPSDARENAAAWKAVEAVLAADNAITQAVVVDVRESMRNGGGPACLRLRVPVDGPARAAIDPRFLLDAARWETLARVVEAHWPEKIAAVDLVKPELWTAAREAHAALEAAIA